MCLFASNFDAKKITTAKEFGYKFGLLFQLADDIKDGDKCSEEKYNLRALLKEANLLLENPLFKACQKNLSDLMLYVCNNL